MRDMNFFHLRLLPGFFFLFHVQIAHLTQKSASNMSSMLIMYNTDLNPTISMRLRSCVKPSPTVYALDGISANADCVHEFHICEVS